MTSSHITRLFSFVALVLLIALSPVAADIQVSHYDHSQYMSAAQEQVYVCSCASTVEYYEVTNQGDFAADFEFSLEAEMDWVTLHEHWARLAPGETKTLAVTIEPPCGLEMDPVYKIYSSSQYGRFAVAESSVTATVCESLSFSLEQEDNNVLPCTQADFQVYLENVAPYDETYTLESNDPNVEFATQELSLAPGERTQVPANVQYSCDVSGEQVIEFSATAQNSQSTHTRSAILNIQDDYEYLIQEVDTQQTSFCAEVVNTKQLQITNIADTQNTYRLSHAGPSFVSLSDELVTLQPGLSRVVELRIAQDAPIGEFSSTISAVSEFGDAQKEIQVAYDTRSCYDLAVAVEPQEQVVCAGQAQYNVRFENRGESTETYTLTPQGAIFSQVSRSQFSLRPSENTQVTLTASVPDRDDQYTIELVVDQTPGLQRTVDIPLTGVSNAACTQLTTSERKLTVYRDETVWPVIIENEGLRASVYNLSLESDAVTLREDQVFLASGEQAIIHLEAQNLESLADGQYVAEFRAVSDRSEYREDFHLTVQDKGFLTQLHERMFYGQDGFVDWCLVLLVFLTVVSLILIALLLFTRGFSLQADFARVLIALLALAAIVFFVLAISTAAVSDVPRELVDEPRGTNYSALYHEFEQNTVYDLDFSRYFVDPDGGELSYTHSQPENLNIFIQDDVARITPQRGFSGQTNVVFTASDESGASVDSPIVSVRVLEVVPTSSWQVINAYCSPINFALLTLISLLLIGLLAGYREDEDDSSAPANSALVESGSGAMQTTSDSRVVGQPVSQQRPAGTQVGGDVVAGDKVTYNTSSKPQVLVGSSGGKKVHRRTCSTVDRISKEKRVTFSSEKEAIEAGYSGCKLCQSFSD